ncbi:MAG: hypothetical protein LBF89_04300 [Bacteroidales bacterium]|nr:hypothetical protein [Bacteroidales bacterium]
MRQRNKGYIPSGAPFKLSHRHCKLRGTVPEAIRDILHAAQFCALPVRAYISIENTGCQ